MSRRRDRLMREEAVFLKRHKAVCIIAPSLIAIFLLELFVAIQPSFSTVLTIVAMVIASILGGLNAFLNAMWSFMAGLRRGSRETPLHSFIGSLDRFCFHIIFLISIAGIFWSEVRVWALWVNVIIPLRWLLSNVWHYLKDRRAHIERLVELSCPEKIEVKK